MDGRNGCCFTGVLRKGLSEELTSQHGSEGSEGASKPIIRRNSVPGRGNSVGKCLKSVVCWVCSRNSKSACLEQSGQWEEKVVRDESDGARSRNVRQSLPIAEPWQLTQATTAC